MNSDTGNPDCRAEISRGLQLAQLLAGLHRYYYFIRKPAFLQEMV